MTSKAQMQDRIAIANVLDDWLKSTQANRERIRTQTETTFNELVEFDDLDENNRPVKNYRLKIGEFLDLLSSTAERGLLAYIANSIQDLFIHFLKFPIFLKIQNERKRAELLEIWEDSYQMLLTRVLVLVQVGSCQIQIEERETNHIALLSLVKKRSIIPQTFIQRNRKRVSEPEDDYEPDED